MAIKFEKSDLTEGEADILIVPMRGGDKAIKGLTPKMSDQLIKILKTREFDGNWGKAEFVLGLNLGKALFVAVVGLGKDKTGEQEDEGMRRGAALVSLEVGRLGLSSLGVSLAGEVRADRLAAAVTESVELSGYRFIEHSKKLAKQHKKKQFSKLLFWCDASMSAAVKKAVAQASDRLKGVKLTRDLVNQPAGNMSPKEIVKTARKIAAASPSTTLRVLNKKQAEKEGFNAFLAVAKGSSEEPYVVHLKHTPRKAGKDRKKVWLVGKGITFDSGGLSLKPADGMETMKGDMAGAATVLGVFSILDKSELDVEVHGVIAACENMPSGSSYRPGDVLTAKNGKTIEVLNTDAEGRITLADALSYAAESKPDIIIDVATLTGACMVALGETVAGLWSNNEDIKKKLTQSSKSTGENIETMPMPEEYAAKLDSHLADLSNMSSTRYGGAITAAMFLREFVDDVPWGHLDIAGPAFMDRRHIPYWDRGATGFGVRTLVNFLESFNTRVKKNK